MAVEVDIIPSIESFSGAVFDDVGSISDSNFSPKRNCSGSSDSPSSMRHSAARRSLVAMGMFSAAEATSAVGGDDGIS